MCKAVRGDVRLICKDFPMPTIFDDIIPNPANLPIPRATVEEMERAGECAMWDHLIRATDLERLMDRQARDESIR